MLKQNEGKVDRIIRVVIGVVLVAAGFFVSGVTAIVLWVLGGIALFTAITGFCLLYMPFGISTNKKK
ncbi:MAG: DUF2892 domain-containing protein [bacterium]